MSDRCEDGRMMRHAPAPDDPYGEIDTGRCRHLKRTYEGNDGERYHCEVCGLSYFLDYEEMK